MMEKTIFSKKHALIKLTLVLLLVLFAFSFAVIQAVDLSAYAEEGDNAVSLEEEYGFNVDFGNYTQGTFLRVKSIDQYPVFTLTFASKKADRNACRCQNFRSLR